jgi:hypothetical protein
MPRAEIASKQALFTLAKLHSELAGKLLANKAEGRRITTAMLQVEAVMKMLEPGYDVRPIAVRRRTANPWFKRGTVFRSAIDALRVAAGPLTTREIVLAMLAAKGVTDASPKGIRDLGGAVQSSLRNHKDGSVVAIAGGYPERWALA